LSTYLLYYTSILKICQPIWLNSSMANTITLFPNYVFEGKLEISNTVHENIQKDVKKDLTSGKTRRTNYGFATEKEIPLEKSLKKLSLLMGNTFINLAKKHNRIIKIDGTKNKKDITIQIVNYLIKKNVIKNFK